MHHRAMPLNVRQRRDTPWFDREASQTRDSYVARNATLRAARPDSSLRIERLFGMTKEMLSLPIEPANEDTSGS
jgi:hypothetical protein